jgi:hypothetical protein
MKFASEQELAAGLPGRSGVRGVIAVDGFPLAGKTSLAAKLSALTGFQAFDLDPYFIRGGNDFVAGIDRERLAADICAAAGPSIISGICVLDVLDVMRTRTAAHVYVKCLGFSGTWFDGEDIDSDTVERRLSIPGAESEVGWMHIQVRDYHRLRRPHERADHIFEWTRRH